MTSYRRQSWSLTKLWVLCQVEINTSSFIVDFPSVIFVVYLYNDNMTKQTNSELYKLNICCVFFPSQYNPVSIVDTFLLYDFIS